MITRFKPFLLSSLILLTALIASCKKEDEASDSVSLSISAGSGYSLTLPKTVTFVANAPGAESVTWDFGDGNTGTGTEVSNVYTAFGCYKVKATARKGGTSSTAELDLSVSFYRRMVVNAVEVLQIPPSKPGGIDWDAGDLPDLRCRIIFPGDTIWESNAVISNSDKGTFNIIPVRGTYLFDRVTRFEIYDDDPGSDPNREIMGRIDYRFCPVVPDTGASPIDSVIVSNGALRLNVKYTFIN